ncbi:MAG: PRC-barrel domain-containing protein [Chloroflexi bacterium]|nr:PRC-barrel domain-containing protein [Chloroflexota bacterium]MBV9896468.1 PRC-barrel domain-containing protein [Chloroflexota bacterium]
MRLTRVTGLPVVDTHVARQAGIVSDVLLDMQAGRVAVLNVKHADGWLVQRIPAEYIYRLGPHTVLVADTIAVDLGPPLTDQRWFPIESLLGLQVMTEGGDAVGQIFDAELDDHTLDVRAYLLRKASGAWKRAGRVHPDEVVVCSPELMLVRERKK